MKIIADLNILDLEKAFGAHAEIIAMPPKQINNTVLKDADALLCRSTVKINEALLAGTALQWIGNCVSGTDHIDLDLLAKRNIPFFSAKGCNADAVRDYVLRVLQRALLDNKIPAQFKIAIIGAGCIGSSLSKALQYFGIEAVLCDPFVDIDHTPLDQIKDCDAVSVHVPLIRDGEHPTYHMLDLDFFKKQKPGCLYINAARAGVISQPDFESLMQTNPVALDVWHHEPQVVAEHLAHAYIGTPHLAGHTNEAKKRGTWLIFNQLADEMLWPSAELPGATGATITNSDLSQLPMDFDIASVSDEFKALDISEFYTLRNAKADRQEWVISQPY